MASKWLSSPLARLAFLTGGTVLLTLGISRNENEWLWIGGFLIALALYLFYASQKQLREKSWLMLELSATEIILSAFLRMASSEENVFCKMRSMSSVL